MNKKLVGLLLISLGIGIIITMIIPEEFWSFLVAILAIFLGILLINSKGC